MKLSAHTQLGLGFTQKMKDNLLMLQIQNMIKNNVEPHDQAISTMRIKRMFSEEKNQNYVFRKTAQAIAEGIKMSKGKAEDFRFLRKLQEKKVTFLMGKEAFYRWEKLGTDIFCIYVEQRDKIVSTPIASRSISASLDAITVKQDTITDLRYWIFGFDLETGFLLYPPDERDEVVEGIIMRFVRMLIFTELSKLETIVLKPREKFGTKKEGKFINDHRDKVVIVDSTWNKIFVNQGEFGVSRHLRLQACGKEWSDRELIVIKEFKKKGYNRKALKELAEEKTEKINSEAL
jgi:hypothetical protein